MSSFHLDTDYLINYLGDTIEPTSGHASRVVNRLLSKKIDVKASLLALGEAIKVSCEKPGKFSLDDLAQRVKQQKVRIYRPEVKDLDASASAVVSVRKSIWSIGAMDIIHLAHALTDDTTRGLLTFDTHIINNPGIANLKKEELWRDGFLISNDSGV